MIDGKISLLVGLDIIEAISDSDLPRVLSAYLKAHPEDEQLLKRVAKAFARVEVALVSALDASTDELARR